MITFTVPGNPVAKGRGYKKATDLQVEDSYRATGSCKKTALQLGMCPQSVHERLQRMGLSNPVNVFTDSEKQTLKDKYNEYANRGDIESLAASMGRTKQFICRKAREIGLTEKTRSKSYLVDQMSIRAKEWIAANGHPRGALGMKHSDKSKKQMSESSTEMWSKKTPEEVEMWVMKIAKTKVANGTSVQERPNASWKAGWREIGGVNKYYRSKWEANYAYYLEWLKQKGQISDWKHEPKTFWFDGIKRGCVSYLPDFLVTEINGSEAYHEVKGWMDERSVTKIKRMAKYHPNVKLIVIDSKGYAALKKSVQGLIPGWEA